MAWIQRHLTSVILLIVLATFLGIHAYYFWPFFSDDALISLRYGRRFAEGLGLTWTGTERVEGYTDLLWVLFAAAAHRFRLDPILVARVLGVVGAFAAIFFVSLDTHAKRIDPHRALMGGLALAWSCPVAVWAIGGLEHGFMTGVLAAALVLLRDTWERDTPKRRDLLLGGLLLGILCLSRADGFVLTLTCLFGLLISRKPSWRSLRHIATIAAVPVFLLGLQLLFRILYYGEFVPNTALVKVAFNTHRLVEGLRHVQHGYTPLLPLIALVIGVVGLSIRRLSLVRWVLPVTVTLGWSAYVVLVGGDIFPGWRQLLLAIIPLALLLGEGASELARLGRKKAWIINGIGVVLLFFGGWLQLREGENIRAKNERWEWDGYVIGPMLRIAFGAKEPLLAVDAAGALPYWSRLPSLDMLGLNDKYIAQHPPATFGTSGIGHELGDGAYVWERSPDIIAFNNAAGARQPKFVSGRQMLANPAFKDRFQLIRMKGFRDHRPIAELWIHREGRIGFEKTDDRIQVPGYFFAGGSAFAILHEKQLVTEITSNAPGKLPNLALERGRWKLVLDPPSSALEIGVHCGNVSAVPLDTKESIVLEMSRNGAVDILVGLSSGSHWLTSATLVNTKEPSTHRCAFSRAPSSVMLENLSNVAKEGSDWDYPTHQVFSEAGIVVQLPDALSAPAVHLSLDNNDIIELRFLYEGKVQAKTECRPKPGIVGMTHHRVRVPDEAIASGYDSIAVIPLQGDGRYSLGHLLLLAK